MMIYFIQAGKNGPIKIGQTGGNIKDRVAQLQTGCPYKLKLLWVYTGSDWSESEVHSKFKHEKIHGEWFHPSRMLLNFINMNMSNIVEVPIFNTDRVLILDENPGYVQIESTFSFCSIWFNTKSGNVTISTGKHTIEIDSSTGEYEIK